ncbi:MAG: hypothetical protein ACYCYQ_14860 [Acidimicrobiales bacterium]
MPSERQRQLHRERKNLARRQQARQAEARETQRQQAAAEARRAFAHRRHRHVAGLPTRWPHSHWGGPSAQ